MVGMPDPIKFGQMLFNTNDMNENTIKVFTTEGGTVYTPCETSEAEGLWSNGKFIEGTFDAGFYPTDGKDASYTWERLGAIPVKKVVPKKEPLVWTGSVARTAFGSVAIYLPGTWDGKRVEVREVTEPEPAPELVGPKDGGLER